MDKSATAMELVESGQMEASFTIIGDVQGEEWATFYGVSGDLRLFTHMVGDFQFPNQRILQTYEINDLKASVQYTIVGDSVYILTEGEGYSKTTADVFDVPFGVSDVLSFVDNESQEFVLVGRGEIDGEEVYYLKGPFSADEIEFPLPNILVQEGSVEYWIGIEDSLVRKIVVNVQTSESDDSSSIQGQVVWNVELAKYGESFDIQAPTVEEPDDHGNEPSTATAISAGAAIEGMLDSGLDADYFSVSVEKGRGYQVEVQHARSWITAALLLYGPDGVTEIPVRGRVVHQGSTLIAWIASDFSNYYIALEPRALALEVYGGIADYTLSITPFSDVDDHGNEAMRATLLLAGEVLEGTLNNPFDADFFRFYAQEGQGYSIKVDHQNLPGSKVTLYDSGGMIAKGRFIGRTAPNGTDISWIAPSSGEYYLAVDASHGYTGTYKIRMELSDEF